MLSLPIGEHIHKAPPLAGLPVAEATGVWCEYPETENYFVQVCIGRVSAVIVTPTLALGEDLDFILERLQIMWQRNMDETYSLLCMAEANVASKRLQDGTLPKMFYLYNVQNDQVVEATLSAASTMLPGWPSKVQIIEALIAGLTEADNAMLSHKDLDTSVEEMQDFLWGMKAMNEIVIATNDGLELFPKPAREQTDDPEPLKNPLRQPTDPGFSPDMFGSEAK